MRRLTQRRNCLTMATTISAARSTTAIARSASASTRAGRDGSRGSPTTATHDDGAPEMTISEHDKGTALCPVLQALDEFRIAMAKAYRVCVELSEADEHRAREVQSIDEILEWRPLASFKAEHLVFLETLIAFWRDLEVPCGQPALAPEPDPLQ